MLELLFALCNGLVNAGRGSGIKGGKVYTILCMLISAYIITQNIYLTILFPIPLLAFWWQPGGTGRHMPWIIDKLSFLGLGNSTWRFFEFASVFIYSLICGLGYHVSRFYL